MAVPDLVVVLLCVLGAGAVVVAGAAFGQHFLPGGNKTDEEENVWAQRSPEQESYMKKVRDNNQMGIFAQIRSERYQARRDNSENRNSGTGVGYDSASGYSGYSGYAGHNGYNQSGSAVGYVANNGHGEHKGYAGSPLAYEDDGYSGFDARNTPAPANGQNRWGNEGA